MLSKGNGYFTKPTNWKFYCPKEKQTPRIFWEPAKVIKFLKEAFRPISSKLNLVVGCIIEKKGVDRCIECTNFLQAHGKSKELEKKTKKGWGDFSMTQVNMSR